MRRIAALAFAVSVAGSAVARERWPLLGTWQTSQAASKAGPAFTRTTVINADGTFSAQRTNSPGPKGKGASVIRWRGTYRITSPTSIVAEPKTFQACASDGACVDCPGNEKACALAKAMGVAPGAHNAFSFEMQGPDRFVANGVTWSRQ
jgi:hypothetical protein